MGFNQVSEQHTVQWASIKCLSTHSVQWASISAYSSQVARSDSESDSARNRPCLSVSRTPSLVLVRVELEVGVRLEQGIGKRQTRESMAI
jgi:hypothetical protein